MRATAEIDSTLLALHTLFDAGLKTGQSEKTLNYYCKLALMELCGWIEQAMDEIIIDSATRTAISGIDKLKNRVEKTYSFDYEDAFRPLLLLLLGFKQCELLEAKLQGAATSAFNSMLNLLSSLRPHRNTHAHTHLCTATPLIMAPSSVRGHLKTIAKGLIEIEAEMIAMGY